METGLTATIPMLRPTHTGPLVGMLISMWHSGGVHKNVRGATAEQTEFGCI